MIQGSSQPKWDLFFRTNSVSMCHMLGMRTVIQIWNKKDEQWEGLSGWKERLRPGLWIWFKKHIFFLALSIFRGKKRCISPHPWTGSWRPVYVVDKKCCTKSSTVSRGESGSWGWSEQAYLCSCPEWLELTDELWKSISYNDIEKKKEVMSIEGDGSIPNM